MLRQSGIAALVLLAFAVLIYLALGFIEALNAIATAIEAGNP